MSISTLLNTEIKSTLDRASKHLNISKLKKLFDMETTVGSNKTHAYSFFKVLNRLFSNIINHYVNI